METVTNGFVDWWRNTPRDYDFRFPLPGLTGLTLPIRLGTNVEIRNEPWSCKEVEKPGLFAPLRNALIQGPQVLVSAVSYVCVKPSGLLSKSSASDSASHRADINSKDSPSVLLLRRSTTSAFQHRGR